MATAKAGKSKVGKTKKAAKKPAPQRPASAAKKAASTKAPAKKAVMKKSVAKQAAGAKKSVASKSAVKKSVAKKTAMKKAVAKRPVAGKVASTADAASSGSKQIAKAPPNKSTPGRPAGDNRIVPPPVKKTAPDSLAPTSARKPRKITPEQALANTRALLKAKKEHDRQPQPWQMLDQQAGPVEHPGYQSPEAADKAEQLHEGESRMQAIQGSISSTDRKNQGKRDKR